MYIEIMADKITERTYDKNCCLVYEKVYEAAIIERISPRKKIKIVHYNGYKKIECTRKGSQGKTVYEMPETAMIEIFE